MKIFKNWWRSSRTVEDLQELLMIFKICWRSSRTVEDLQELLKIFKNLWRSSRTFEDLQEPLKIFKKCWRSSKTVKCFEILQELKVFRKLGVSRSFRCLKSFDKELLVAGMKYFVFLCSLADFLTNVYRRTDGRTDGRREKHLQILSSYRSWKVKKKERRLDFADSIVTTPPIHHPH